MATKTDTFRWVVEVTVSPRVVQAGFALSEGIIKKAILKHFPTCFYEDVALRFTRTPTDAAIKAAQK